MANFACIQAAAPFYKAAYHHHVLLHPLVATQIERIILSREPLLFPYTQQVIDAVLSIFVAEGICEPHLALLH